MSSFLKILFVLPAANAIGGVSRSAHRLCTSLRSIGHQVWELYPDLSLFPNEKQKTESQWAFHPNGGLQQLSNEVFLAIEELRPDIVVGWYVSSAGVAAVSAAVRAQIPVVVAARGNDIDADFFHPEKHALLSWAVKKASAITAVSTEMVNKISGWFDCSATFISNSVDRSDFYFDAAQTKRFGIRYQLSQKPVLGLFGEFKPKRGLDLLSRIAPEIAYWQPMIVGHVRPSVAHLLPPNALLIDYIRDLPQLRGAYGVCDAVIQPSLYDGMPNVVLEALACERNVLSSRAGGLADLSTSQFNAHICISDEDWVHSLQKIRTGEFTPKSISLPSPQEEALKYCDVFYTLM